MQFYKDGFRGGNPDVKPAAPNLIAQRRPFEILQKLRLPREALQSKALGPADAEWQRLARLNNLWFVRRRHLAYRDDLAGSYREIAGNDERVIELNLNTRITQLGLTPRYDAVLKVATPAAASTARRCCAAPAPAPSGCRAPSARAGSGASRLRRRSDATP